MIAKRTVFSLIACTLAAGGQAAPIMPSDGATEQESQSQAPVVEEFIPAFPFIPRWDIDYRGMHTPPGGSSCWYNPFDWDVSTYQFSCHRPDDVFRLERSFTANIGFSVEDEDSLESNWEIFRLARWAKEGISIGGSVTTAVTMDITADDCYDITVEAFPPYNCVVYDVTWTWLWWQKTATVYIWHPIGGRCLVWSNAEFDPTCDGCDEYYPPPPNGHWFCASDDAAEPVWADWCDQEDCTDDPGSVECESFVTDSFLELEDAMLSEPQSQQQEQEAWESEPAGR